MWRVCLQMYNYCEVVAKITHVCISLFVCDSTCWSLNFSAVRESVLDFSVGF